MIENKRFNGSDQKKNDKPKRSQSLPKLPNPQSYTPIPAQYNTFDAMKSIDK